MKTVAFVGLGKIANVAVDAIAQKEDISVIGGFDIGETPEWWEARPSANSLEELIAANPDYIVISTPSSTHIDVIRQVLKINPNQKILVEKPLDVDPKAVKELLEEVAPDQLTVFYHAAYAPEVLWAEEMLPVLIAQHGEIVSYQSFFSDPYSSQGNEQQNVSTYTNSWVDSGINCLSVLKRLGLVDKITDLKWDKIKFSTACVKTKFGNNTGTIVTQWDVTAPSKSTTLHFTDGTVAVLDHQATAARVFNPKGEVEVVFGENSDIPRLVRHYMNLFESEVIQHNSPFTNIDHMNLHAMLLGALELSNGTPTL